MIVQEIIDTVDREIASALDDYTTAPNLDTASNIEQTVLDDDDLEDNKSLVTLSNGDLVDIF